MERTNDFRSEAAIIILEYLSNIQTFSVSSALHQESRHASLEKFNICCLMVIELVQIGLVLLLQIRSLIGNSWRHLIALLKNLVCKLFVR